MRIALGVAYEGTYYHGWQLQENLTTVQGCLEQAISKVADCSVNVICAGRTDRGVHAVAQVVHFDTHAERDMRSWVLGTNTHLPPDIRVHWAQQVSDEFHARFSATTRAYRYIIFNRAIRSAILHSHTSWHIYPLDEKRMQAAAQYLVGEHDFSSFRANECQAKSPVRTIHYLTVKRVNDFVIVDIKANAFLHHMVRNITGVLLAIGEGKQEPIWVQEVLEAKNRTQAGITAPAAGLYLTEVNYPGLFKIPNTSEVLLL